LIRYHIPALLWLECGSSSWEDNQLAISDNPPVVFCCTHHQVLNIKCRSLWSSMNIFTNADNTKAGQKAVFRVYRTFITPKINAVHSFHHLLLYTGILATSRRGPRLLQPIPSIPSPEKMIPDSWRESRKRLVLILYSLVFLTRARLNSTVSCANPT
jgi:hypothetical protein